MKWLIILPMLFLMGCATLGDMFTDLPTAEEAQPQISAVAAVTEGIVNEPYGTAGAIAIGYALALLRKWYKKQKGAKG